MLKDYVLGAEVATLGGFHIANISMLFKELPLVEGIDFLKFGGITLLNKNSNIYPKYIKAIIDSDKVTDLTNLFPLTFFKDTVENNMKLVKNKFRSVKICDKQFVEITDDELRDVFMNDDLVLSVVKNEEIDGLVEENYIDGYIKLSEKASLTWY
jgi:hypothetical protein